MSSTSSCALFTSQQLCDLFGFLSSYRIIFRSIGEYFFCVKIVLLTTMFLVTLNVTNLFPLLMNSTCKLLFPIIYIISLSIFVFMSVMIILNFRTVIHHIPYVIRHKKHFKLLHFYLL